MGATLAYRPEGKVLLGHIDDRSPTGWELVEREDGDGVWPPAFSRDVWNTFVRAMRVIGGPPEFARLIQEGTKLSLDDAAGLVLGHDTRP